MCNPAADADIVGLSTTFGSLLESEFLLHNVAHTPDTRRLFAMGVIAGIEYANALAEMSAANVLLNDEESLDEVVINVNRFFDDATAARDGIGQ